VKDSERLCVLKKLKHIIGVLDAAFDVLGVGYDVALDVDILDGHILCSRFKELFNNVMSQASAAS
jgi:hypothetical protein